MPKDNTLKSAIDFRSLFNSLPGLYLVLSPDLRIITANDAYAQSILINTKQVERQFVFEVFPENTDAAGTDAHHVSRQSLEQVIATKQPHTIASLPLNMPVQAETRGGFETKHWWVTNTPVLDSKGEISYIIQEARDISQQVASGSPVNESNQLKHDLTLKESNERFERIAKATNDVLWDWNLQNNTLWWNDGFSSLYGYKASEVEPDISSWTSRIHHDDLQTVTEAIHHAIDKGKEVWQATYRFRCADGSYKMILDRGYLIKDIHGKAVRMVGAMLDITEKLQIEQKLQEQMVYTNQLLESLPLMLWTATPDGRINYYNQQWFEYTGINLNKTEDLGWQHFLHPDDIEESERRWLHSLTSGEPLIIENRWRSAKDNTYRWFLAKAVPLRDSQGNITLWVGSNTDIEPQKQVQAQLESSEKQFRFLTESIPQMVWSANPDGYIDYTNQRWFEYTKMDENSLGFGWAPAIHPNEVENLMNTWLNCVATGENLEFQVRFQDTIAKTYRWFLLRAEPMYNEAGQIVKWFGTATDIHDQKLLQEQLQESEQQFRFLSESIPQMVWTTTPDGTTDYFNNRWISYTGLSLEESLGPEAWLKVLHPDDVEMALKRWLHSVHSGDYYEIEYRIRSIYTGTYRWFLGQGLPMRDNEGNITRWFGTCTDIEDHKKAEEELLEKNIELERTNQDLDSFVYTASHDLKLPILNMAGIFDELTRVAEFKDPDAPKMIEMFNRSLQQIQTTIDELSEVVKVQKAGRRELEYLPLQDITRDVLESLQHSIESTQADIITDFADAPYLYFTRPGLKSILYNLISNAIKYKSNDRQPVIYLNSRIKDNFVELQISDNGVGLDISKHQNKLFKMFKRFHNHVNGSGLGLYIVNRLLTNQGGYINIESQLNKGTTFYLYFKQKKA